LALRATVTLCSTLGYEILDVVETKELNPRRVPGDRTMDRERRRIRRNMEEEGVIRCVCPRCGGPHPRAGLR
jgi:hypothetical protein